MCIVMLCVCVKVDSSSKVRATTTAVQFDDVTRPGRDQIRMSATSDRNLQKTVQDNMEGKDPVDSAT